MVHLVACTPGYPGVVRLVHPWLRCMRMRMCIAGALVDRLLTQTLRLADLAMPIDPWRGRLWAAAPLPPLCSALTAYRSDAPGMRGLIVEAAGRLINGSERHLHPDNEAVL